VTEAIVQQKLNEAIFGQEKVLEAVKDQRESFPKAGLVSLDQLRLQELAFLVVLVEME
jgi:hypothetical protein